MNRSVNIAALNLNIHLHMLVLDGVYTFDHEGPRFHRIKAPTQCKLQRPLHTIARRVTGALERQGLLIRDIAQPYLDLEAADGFEGQAYLQLLGDAVHYRIATGPHAVCFRRYFHFAAHRPSILPIRFAQSGM